MLVIGYGLLGAHVLNALTSPPLSSQVRTHLLVKPASLAYPSKRTKVESFVAKCVTIIEGDVANGSADLAPLLTSHSIHTVVNVAMTWPITDVDTPVLEACKTAGVRRLIPSDYGMSSDDMNESCPMWATRWRAKAALHDKIKQSGMDWTFLAAGGLAELLFKSQHVRSGARHAHC